MNLSSRGIVEKLDLNYLESETHYWSVPEGANEILEFNEAVRHSITVGADITTMKTCMTKHSQKDNTELKIGTFFSTKIGFLPQEIY